MGQDSLIMDSVNPAPKVDDVKSLANAIRRNFFAGYLTASFAFGFLFVSIVLTILAPLMGELSLLAISIFSAIVYVPTLLMIAWVRLSARKTVVRISGILIAVASLMFMFFVLSVAGAFLFYEDVYRPYIENRLAMIMLSVPLAIHYWLKVLVASVTPWLRSYARLSALYRNTPEAIPRLFNLVPPYVKLLGLGRRLPSYILGGSSVILIGFTIMGLFFQPLASMSDVLPIENGEFQTNTLSPSDRDLVVVLPPEDYTMMATTEAMTFLLMIPLIVLLTMPLRYLALRIMRLDAAKIADFDGRPPLLYLRAFRDDKIKMKGRWFSLTKYITQSYRIKKLDELLAEYFWHIGPVIAAESQTRGAISVRGPALEQYEMSDWKPAVKARIDEAALIILQMNETEGVKWEFEQCLQPDAVERSVFVFGLQAKAIRENIVCGFLETIGFEDKAALGFKLGQLLSAHYDGSVWCFHVSSRRTKFDYMAALLIATRRVNHP